MTQTDEAPDVVIARLVDRTFASRDDRTDDRTTAFAVIEHLLNGADRLARKVMDTDEQNTFCVHLDAALAELDDMD